GAESDANRKPGGGCRVHPPRDASRSGRQMPRDEPARKIDHATGPSYLLDSAQNLLLLRAETLGRENGLAVGVRCATEAVHEAGELGVARRALGAVGQVLGGARIDRFAAMLGQIAVEDLPFIEMTRTSDHGLPPSSPLSLRAARNRCTRTVDSF